MTLLLRCTLKIGVSTNLLWMTFRHLTAFRFCSLLSSLNGFELSSSSWWSTHLKNCQTFSKATFLVKRHHGTFFLAPKRLIDSFRVEEEGMMKLSLTIFDHCHCWVKGVRAFFQHRKNANWHFRLSFFLLPAADGRRRGEFWVSIGALVQSHWLCRILSFEYDHSIKKHSPYS